MKQFLKYILLFSLPIIVLGISFEILLRNIPNDYRNKRIYLDKNSDSLNVLFLGSSHTLCGLNPELISKKSFNAAYVSQSLDYDYEILRKYGRNQGEGWDSLSYIFLPISYCSLFERLETSSEDWRIKNYVLYYKMDVSDKITDHSEMLGNKLWINLYRLLNFYVLGKNATTCSELGWESRTTDPNTELISSGKKRAKLHTIKDNSCFDENVKILESIINYAEERQIKIVLYTLPAYKSYVENLDSSQLNQSLSVVKQMTKKYKHVSYYNLLNDTTFVAEDFFDSDHLNKQGSTKFTNEINRLITQLDKQPTNCQKQ